MSSSWLLVVPRKIASAWCGVAYASLPIAVVSRTQEMGSEQSDNSLRQAVHRYATDLRGGTEPYAIWDARDSRICLSGERVFITQYLSRTLVLFLWSQVLHRGLRGFYLCYRFRIIFEAPEDIERTPRANCFGDRLILLNL
jgi:hypothetical protein